MNRTSIRLQWLFFLLVVFSLFSCKSGNEKKPEASAGNQAPAAGKSGNAKAGLHILAGSEIESLRPIIDDFARENGWEIRFDYKGSVDIMVALADEKFPYDAVWPANSLWISLGDARRRVRHLQSIATTPVAFGIRSRLARELGFTGRTVAMREILAAVKDGRLKFLMTSATQSNSGASAYLGFLYALSGNPDVLTLEHLRQESLRADIAALLSGVHRGSGSSGWLKDLFLAGSYDAMVNYESLILETSRELVQRGREPLHLVYPVDGTALADSPLGFVRDPQHPEREEIFLKLQQHLLSEPVQKRISSLGWRTGIGGITTQYDPGIFREEWGVDTKRILTPLRIPAPEVVREALDLYQTDFRKPSYTVFCLDFSSSMQDKGETELKAAMRFLLRPDMSARYLLQPGKRDRLHIIAFSDRILRTWNADGGKTESLLAVEEELSRFPVGGQTAIHSCVIEGLNHLNAVTDIGNYTPAIILMTDGKSNMGADYRLLEETYRAMGRDIPVFSILFGHASPSQLNAIASLTRGRVFDGRMDLLDAFRKVKGYN